MTERLYYADSYLTEFDAQVVDAAEDGRRIYLNRTAFYPTSGGQLFDTGTLNGVRVMDVVDEGERIAHVLDAAMQDERVDGRIDWERRFDHMQQHTGQHVLSAVFDDRFGHGTVSVHFGEEICTLDVDVATIEPERIVEAERRANEIVLQNRPVGVYFEDAAAAQGLRKPPPRAGLLRIVEIAGVDRSACGGTHVRSTGEIGPVLLRKLDRVRHSTRIEFVCGRRALRLARADFEAISAVARTLNSSPGDAPALVAAQAERLTESERVRRRLAGEILAQRAHALHAAAPLNDRGVRCALLRASADDSAEDLRTLAQEFSRLPVAVLAILGHDAEAILLAASEDSGVDAGALLKRALVTVGGRGGGSARVAQGRAPTAEAGRQVLDSLLAMAG